VLELSTLEVFPGFSGTSLPRNRPGDWGDECKKGEIQGQGRFTNRTLVLIVLLRLET
jgi:hypothetical protein